MTELRVGTAIQVADSDQQARQAVGAQEGVVVVADLHDVKMIPVYVAAGVVPLIKPRRCVQLGEMIRDAVAAYEGDERVAIIGTAGRPCDAVEQARRRRRDRGMHTTVVWLLELLALGIDGVVWGVAACTAYRSIAGAGRHWVAPALVFGVVFVAWDHWVFGELVHWAGFPRGHGEPLRLLEAGIQLGSTLVGFRAGELLVSSIARGARERGFAAADGKSGGAAPHAG